MPRTITIHIDEKAGFDCKKYNDCNKLFLFQLNTVKKMNFRLLVMISYDVSGLGSRNVQSVWEVFK